MRRKVGVLAVIVALAAGVGAPPTAADPPPRIVSRYEIESGMFLQRDAGYSVPLSGSLAGNSLWLFGDTAVSPTGAPGDPGAFFLPGTWGAVGPAGPGVVPTVSEIPAAGTPVDAAPSGRFPNAVLPAPTGLLWPDGQTSCGSQDPSFFSYAASWPFGATAGPAGSMSLRTDGSSSSISVDDGSRLVFIPVAEVCVVANKEGVPPTPPRGFESLADDVWSEWPDMVIQRQKLVAYSPACVTVRVSGQPARQVCNGIVASMTLFRTTDGTALPWRRFLHNPVFSGGFLYLNAHKCTNWVPSLGSCIGGTLTSVRVPVTSMHDPGAYRWYRGPGQWGAESGAASVLPAGVNGGAILTDLHDFGSVGDGYLLMQQWNFGGGYQLWKGASPAGPWTLASQGVIPGCQSGAGKGCYSLVGHPELSRPDDVVYTFFDRTDGFLKRSTVGAVP